MANLMFIFMPLDLSPVENPMKHQFHPCFIYVGVCNYQALSSTWSGISRIFCYVYRKFWCILNKHWRGNTRDMYWHFNEKKYWHIKLLMKKENWFLIFWVQDTVHLYVEQNLLCYITRYGIELKNNIFF